jgi:predicted nucleic acid-binding protein
VKYILDTNVYLAAFRSVATRAQFRQAFFPLLPATFLSAVVAYELSVDARDSFTRDLVRDFIHPLERARRLVTPSFDDWMEASRIITSIAERNRGWRSKLPALLNDVLIALTARNIGAILLTHNREDFLLIRRYKNFELRILEVS